MIGLVENAMVARIKAASDVGAISYAYRSMQTWPKNFDEYLSSQTVQYPACWAAFAGAHQTRKVATGIWQVRAAFGLVVAALNARNEESRRHGGSAAEPGSYQLAIDAMVLLGDQRLGLDDMTPLEPASILPVEAPSIPALKQVSIYAVSFDTWLTYRVAQLSEIDNFVTFHADWDPAPYGHVAPPLPDDAPAIAVDHITLETA